MPGVRGNRARILQDAFLQGFRLRRLRELGLQMVLEVFFVLPLHIAKRAARSLDQGEATLEERPLLDRVQER